MVKKLHYQTWVLAYILPDIDIYIAAVTNFLKEVIPYKAIGPDCIPAKVQKNGWRTLPKLNFDIYCLPATRNDTTGLEEGLGIPHI